MGDSLVTFSLLATLSVAYIGSAAGIERFRLTVSQREVSSMLGVFTFAAVMALPFPLLVCLVPALYLTAWPAFRRAGAPGHRHAYNGVVVTLACVVASKVLELAGGGILAVLPAIAAFMACNLALVAAAMRIAGHKTFGMLRNPRTHSVVFASQVLGAAVGAALEWHHSVSLLGIPALIVLHRRALFGTVKDTASFDERAGLWSEVAWASLAGEVVRGGKCVTLMIVDATHTDIAVLADVMRGCLRPTDVLGRYGNGHQIALLTLSGSRAAGTVLVRRIRNSINRSGAAYTMGVCTAQGADLHDMTMAALTDLMVARDRSVTRG